MALEVPCMGPYSCNKVINTKIVQFHAHLCYLDVVREDGGRKASQDSELLNKDAEGAFHVDPASGLEEVEIVFALVLTACVG